MTTNEVLLIHGTTAIPNPAKRHWPDKFKTYLHGVFGTTPKVLEWSGAVSVEARSLAAHNVFNFAAELHSTNPKTHLILIGYSHGGNIAIEAINKLAANAAFPVNEAITLITIATPIRPRYQLNTRVRQHINAYNRLDFMQIFGQFGTGTRLYDVGVRSFNGAKNEVAKRYIGHRSMHSNEMFWATHILESLTFDKGNEGAINV